MQQIFTSEFVDGDKQLFVIVGSMPYVTKHLISQIHPTFKCIVLNTVETFPTSESLIHVSNHATSTINELRESIQYAVFFLNTKEDKALFVTLQEKFIRDKTKTIIVIPLSRRDEFYDVILTSKTHPIFQYVLLGDIYGNDIPESASPMAKTLHSVVSKQTITFTGDDLTPLFPISITDVTTGIQSLLFSSHKQRMWLLYYEHPQSLISAAHILRKTIPELSIEYARTTTPSHPYRSHKDISLEVERKTHLEPIYVQGLEGFEKSISTLTPHKQPIIKEARRKKKKKTTSLPPFSLRNSILTNAFIIALLLYIGINIFATAVGAYFARQMVTSLEQGQYVNALHAMRKSHMFLSVSYPLLSAGTTVFSYIPVNSLQESLETFHAGTRLSSTILEEITDLSLSSPFKTQTQLQTTFATLAQMYISIQSSSLAEKFHQLSWFYTPEYTQMLSFAGVMPEILGYGKEKQYLLLFQNNGELRPTGGFIGSVGELQVKNGEITNFSIRDVYELDGQLKTHTEPPFAVRRYLQPHLYLRDSNFSPDFQESATIAAQLYFEQTGKKVDGVVGIDFEVLNQVMKKVGPIYLPSQDKTIDAETSFDVIQQTIEDDFFPGSTGKRDILTEVLTQLTESLKDPNISLSLLQLIPDLMQEKHILVALQDPTLQEIFSSHRYAGELKDKRVSDASTITDFFAFNEANIGVNKVNRKISRTALYNTTFFETRIESTATLILNNKSSDDVYTSYIRLLTPASSTLLSISLNGERQDIVQAVTDARQYEAENFTAPTGLEVQEETYQNRKVFGFVTKVEKGTTQRISVKYDRKIDGLPSQFSYSLLHINQPGTYLYPLTVRVAYPPSVEPKNVTNAVLENRAVVFQESITSDAEFKADFINNGTTEPKE